ncbi:hypothetical protein RJ640_003397 [Escallonia rubra]|uniref:Retrotransposon Copia-like N-terminal domain-containing protein n=1 Tax=Escallonia rubra TaxID=112253 RepID=A0AA88QLQ7_9ASTE|nr:hypothetical protein RJ640_003397 [Escallonia rubra]
MSTGPIFFNSISDRLMGSVSWYTWEMRSVLNLTKAKLLRDLSWRSMYKFLMVDLGYEERIEFDEGKATLRPFVAFNHSKPSNISNINFSMDPSNPYFVHHSDHPGHLLVPIILNGANYPSWSKSMIHALTAKNKIGFCRLQRKDGYNNNKINTEIYTGSAPPAYVQSSSTPHKGDLLEPFTIPASFGC